MPTSYDLVAQLVGYDVDLINRFISIVTKIQKLAQEGNLAREMYEAQAQVCEEMAHKLIPKQRGFAP